MSRGKTKSISKYALVYDDGTEEKVTRQAAVFVLGQMFSELLFDVMDKKPPGAGVTSGKEEPPKNP